MKLIIQIPCYNEEQTLPLVIQDLPTSIPGVAKIETQIIDDGSHDNTIEVAQKLGVNHIIKFKHNQGLAKAFKAGVENALKQGADILVNTDGDNQYKGQDITKLVQPLVKKHADMVVGARPIQDHPEFSNFKKQLQKFGSWVVRKISQTEIIDTTSGFRAYNKEAMLRMNLYSEFSYTLETLIQAGLSNLRVDSVNIRVNPKTRESRLFKNIFHYLYKSTGTILKIGILYRATLFLGVSAFITFSLAIILTLRFIYRITFMPTSSAGTFWPSVILAGILLLISILLYITGIIASLIASNRKLNEEVLYRLKKQN